MKSNLIFGLVLATILPCMFTNEECNQNLKPLTNITNSTELEKILLNKNWYLIASTNTEEKGKQCIMITFTKTDGEDIKINRNETFKNLNNYTFKSYELRELDANNVGIFKPKSDYFSVHDLFDKATPTLLPGMGVNLYIDEELYIEYINYDVVHHWYRECHKRVFIYHKDRIFHKFEPIYKRMKEVLNTVGVSLDTIDIKRNDLDCNK